MTSDLRKDLARGVMFSANQMHDSERAISETINTIQKLNLEIQKLDEDPGRLLKDLNDAKKLIGRINHSLGILITKL
jgi:FtsZ-binding cell division protein ZapB